MLVWHADVVEVACLARGTVDDAPLDDTRLLELMLRGSAGWVPAKVGIDAPLGWPVAFVEAVANLDAWPCLDEPGRKTLTHRRSDRWIHAQTGKLPLSVSTDRIAYPAMRAARLVRAYRAETGTHIDRTGLTGPIAEVYPDTAVTRYGLRPPGCPRLSYKGPNGRKVRAGMLGALAVRAPWLDLCAEQCRRCVESDDLFDALIAALLTRSVQLGLTTAPPSGLVGEAAVEGWIHLPHEGEGGLAALAPPAWAGR